MNTNNSVLIVGGGIAGLVLATQIAKTERRITVIEKAPEWTIKGAGMHLYSNALRALEEIGIAEEIVAASVTQDEYEYADTKDEFQVRVTYPRLTRGDFPALTSISRRVLHDILLGNAQRAGADIRLGTTFTSIRQTADEVDVTFSDGQSGTFDLVVGCDGIYSQVRTEIFGRNDPVYTGQGIWRSILKQHSDSILPKIMYSGGGKMFGIIPIDDEHVYMLAGMPNPDRRRFPEDRFHTLVHEEFGHFGGLAPHYLAEITEPEQVIYTAIEIIEQPAPWYEERVFLIGDAAHASPPYLAQGAAMAIEDSIVLGHLIAQDLEPAELGRQYMDRRYKRANFIQTRSIQRNKERYQGGSYESTDGQKSERMIYLENHAQREIDELYTTLAEPI